MAIHNYIGGLSLAKLYRHKVTIYQKDAPVK